MAVYVVRRLIQAVLILLGVSLVTFALLYLLPADPVRQIAGRSATPQTVENIRRQLGLDQSFVVQYWRYLTSLAQGDLGRSYLQRSEVSSLIWSRLPATLLLMAAGIACELAIGLSMGLVAAVRRGTATDQVLMIGSFIGVSAPQFVVGLLLLYVFGVQLGWLPLSGYGTAAHVVLPALTLGILGAGWYSRMMRSSMIDVLRQDYIRTAHAKGLTRWRVLFRHALPNAILPIVAMIGIDIGVFMSGIVVVESVFGWPGHRPARLAGDPARRHSDHHGGDPRFRGRHRPWQFGCRSRRPFHRPPHQASLNHKNTKTNLNREEHSHEESNFSSRPRPGAGVLPRACARRRPGRQARRLDRRHLQGRRRHARPAPSDTTGRTGR